VFQNYSPDLEDNSETSHSKTDFLYKMSHISEIIL